MPAEFDPTDANLCALIRKIQLLVFDFDGVFTDNSVYVSETGQESIRCSRSDGLDLRRLEAAGVTPMLLSTEENSMVVSRAKKLGISAINGLADKTATLRDEAARQEIDLNEIGYVGNDITDADCLGIGSNPVVVADAWPEVTRLARYATRRAGGQGIVREICDVVHAVHNSATGAIS